MSTKIPQCAFFNLTTTTLTKGLRGLFDFGPNAGVMCKTARRGLLCGAHVLDDAPGPAAFSVDQF
jgi:hypothetical protein